MKRYLQEKFELNHNLTETRLAVLKGAIEMLEKMENFFTHEHLTKKGDLKVCYESTIDGFLAKNSVTFDNMRIRGWFARQLYWDTLHFFADSHCKIYFEFRQHSTEGHFIVDKKINLPMIAEAKNFFSDKQKALEKHIKTRDALEAQLLDLASDMSSKFQDMETILKEWNNPMYDLDVYTLVHQIR